jgi:ESS family glutamate:Na+ symporter
VTEKLFPEYRDEQFLMFYGMLTGTNSTGFTLLREVDPFYKTPAAKNLIYQNLWAVLFGAPMLLLMGFAARSMRWTWITWGLLVTFLVIMLLILFRTFIFRRKKKDGNK